MNIEEKTYNFENEDDLIEYCPELVENEEVAPRVIYVCSWCLRQYDLPEDLRGHMIEYHKCRPIEEKSHIGCSLVDSVVSTTAPAQTGKCKGNAELAAAAVVVAASVPPEVLPELRPVPFKDFRLILRAKMTLRCSVTFSCAYKFENTDKRELHAKCHIDAITAGKYKCFECGGLELASWRSCSAHLWKQHQIDVDLLHCPLCNFKAHTSVLVWRHMRVHKKWRPRVLRSLRAVQQRRQLQQQQKLQLNGEKESPALPPPPPANNTNKYYAEKTCDICSRKFVNGKTLSKHVKTVHNKIKPFICNVCGRKTARKASLIIHMRQHTGEKPLQCKSCKFTTRDPSVLHNHQLRHEKVGKFKCIICDYSCIQTNSYKRHLRLNHPEEYKQIACDLCNYVTTNAHNLQAHKVDHRKGLIVNYEDSMDAMRAGGFKNPQKLDKNSEISADCFLPLESIDSLPHEPAVDTGGVTIPAPSEDTQFPTFLNN